MQIDKSSENGKTVVRLEGRLDTTTAPEFEKALLAAINEKADVVLDFSGVGYVSSAGLRSILIGHKTAGKNGTGMSLRSVSAEVMEVLNMTGFSTILRID